MNITVDRKVADGNGIKIGPFKVIRKDWGLSVEQVGRQKSQRTIVYREEFIVKAYGQFFNAWSTVDKLKAEFYRDGPAALRREMAMLALEDLREVILKARPKKREGK